MSRRSDSLAALETLAHTVSTRPELTEAAERITFLRGRPHPELDAYRSRLTSWQPYKPSADALQGAGYSVTDSLIPRHADLVLLLPDRQKEQTLADLARGLDQLGDGGTLVVSLHNDWGARRFEKALGDLTGNVECLSKHHCRVFWSSKPAQALDEKILSEWRSHAELRRTLDGHYWSRPGLFSWDRIDQGSALLAQHLPATLKGDAADLGAGWGYLSEQLLLKCEDIRSLDCYEADKDGLEATRRLLGVLPVPVRARMRWHDVTTGVGVRKYDVVIANPPFHEGRAADPHLGGKFIAAAAQGLRPGGVFWMVANRQLPYEHLMAEAFEHHEKVAEDNLFKVLVGRQPKPWINDPRRVRATKSR